MRYLLTLALLVMAQPILGAETPAKYALFVGVTKYDHTALNNPALEFPEADAKDLGSVFKDAGYEVDLLLGKDATQANIKKKLANLKAKGDSDGVIVLGFFGHGLEFEASKDACFCPVDTKIRALRDLQGRPVVGNDDHPLLEPDPESLISLPSILSAIRISPAGSRLLLLDCNRTQPNAARSSGSGLKLVDVPANTGILFACSQHEKSFEHRDWGHGAFAKCLIDELRAMMKAGPVTVGTLADRVRPKVKQLVAEKAPRNRQTPQVFLTDSFDLQMTTK